jgi:hypothetical protein
VINLYARLEPSVHDESLEPGFTARLYDPLWTVGRQLAFGELNGDDAGHPVLVQHQGYRSSLQLLNNERFNPAADLLDYRIQRPTIDEHSPQSFRLASLLGTHLLRALAGHDEIVAALRDRHPLIPDGTSDVDDAGTYRQLVTRLGIDGLGALQTVEQSLVDGVLAGVNLTAEVRTLVAQWLSFAEIMRSASAGTSPNWDRSAFRYRATLSTDLGGELVAEELSGDRTDWYSFDVRAADRDTATIEKLSRIPTRAEFRGMPVPRYWEFEPHDTDLGRVDNHPSDIVRAAFLNFGLLYGNDHYLLPIELPVGTLFTTTDLTVTDTFGVTVRIRPAASAEIGSKGWSMFSMTGATATETNTLFLAAVATTSLRSEEMEVVLLIRDEMANVAWAIEKSVESSTGERIDLAARPGVAPTGEPVDAPRDLEYRIGIEPPPRWIPLVPERAGYSLYPTLRAQPVTGFVDRARPLNSFVRTAGDGGRGDDIAASAIPREGRRLVRDYVLGVSPDGRPYLWGRRSTRIGRGEGGSGVRFDVLTTGESEQ